MSVKLLPERHLEFLLLKGGCRGSCESTLVKMPFCWESHVAAHLIVEMIEILLMGQFSLQSQYEHHKEVLAAQGVKIIGKDLEKALAGLPLYVAHDDDEVEYYKVSLFNPLHTR